jgi:hypothetical protein
VAVQAILAGVDITSITLEGSVTKRLNRPATATVKVPSDQTTAGDTARLKVLINGSLDFHGSVEHIEDQGDENSMYSVFTAADPMVIWDWRPARDLNGDYSKPNFIDTFNTGPQILQQILQNSETYEGDLFCQLGTFATGGSDLSGAPQDWPQSIGDIVALLTETGELDVVLTPIDTADIARVDAYNGNFGTDRSGSVSFQYGLGTFNARACRRTVDKSALCNKLRYLLGPRRGTKDDPAGDQHWWGDVDATNPALPNPPQATINAAITTSRTNYGIRSEVKIFDGAGAPAAQPLWYRLWQTEAWLRLKPKTLVHITPQRGIAPTFVPGDQISVSAGTKFRGGFSGTQRVMELTYRWDENGTMELGEPVGMAGAAAVVTTGDTEGI